MAVNSSEGVFALGVLTGAIGGLIVGAIGIAVSAGGSGPTTDDCKIAAQNFGAAVQELGPNDPRFELVVEDFVEACEITPIE